MSKKINKTWYVPKIEDTFLPDLMAVTEEDAWLKLLQYRHLNSDLGLRESVRAIVERAGWSVVKIEIKEA